MEILSVKCFSRTYQPLCLGTGHYLSPGRGGGGVERRILGGISWFLGKQKGGSAVIENPIGGIAENFRRIQGGPLKFDMKTWVDREMLLGGPLQWSDIQREDRLNFT